MTGRLQKGDRVTTPDGDGVVITPRAVLDELNPNGYCIVLLDAGYRRIYRTSAVHVLTRPRD